MFRRCWLIHNQFINKAAQVRFIYCSSLTGNADTTCISLFFFLLFFCVSRKFRSPIVINKNHISTQEFSSHYTLSIQAEKKNISNTIIWTSVYSAQPWLLHPQEKVFNISMEAFKVSERALNLIKWYYYVTGKLTPWLSLWIWIRSSNAVHMECTWKNWEFSLPWNR